ncbi:MAG: murein L,D-transpeptidase catalytic domain family protein [Bacteroidetes bacterium]|nr:murein L,D-transpeptidase catalytic domain family protein [Bacteroidota bacterium]
MNPLRYFLLHILAWITFSGYSQLNDKLSKKAAEAEAFCKKNNMNTSYCFLVDLSIHSGKNRFFVYDFKTKKITSSGLVCHGVGKNSTPEKPVYSNDIGSNCTSLGKYKIGKRAYSNWGINVHYKMHGLEKTNSNAFKRQVVLHSYDYVSGTEIYPSHLTMGWSQGCPVVANNLMTQIDALLQKSKKPTLIWIFE